MDAEKSSREQSKPLSAAEIIERIDVALALHREGGPFLSTTMKIPSGAYRALVDAKCLLSMLQPPSDAAIRCCGNCSRRDDCSRSADPARCALYHSDPSDAAVREAVGVGVREIEYDGSRWVYGADFDRVVEELRSAQAPRLTGERLEAVRKAKVLLADPMAFFRECQNAADELDAAFPELGE